MNIVNNKEYFVVTEGGLAFIPEWGWAAALSFGVVEQFIFD